MSDILRCSFCGRTQEEVRRMAGAGGGDPDVYICNDCARLFDERMKERKETGSGEAGAGDHFLCSFCGNERGELYRLAAREQKSGVCICSKCVDARHAMMEDSV